MGNVTAFMIVCNGELLLPRCLASLAGAVDEVVALDTGSTDGTRAIVEAAARGDWPAGSSDPATAPPPLLRWYSHAFTDFGSARQGALDLVTTEWALWIDADEALSPALRERLGDSFRRPARLDAAGAACASGAFGASGAPGANALDALDSCDVWEAPDETRVLGRVMRGRNLARRIRPRLFRTRLGRISASLVHEGLVLAPGARVGRLEEPILHEAMTSWRAYLKKVDLYTTLETAGGGRRFDPLHLIVTGPATLWREYVGRGGWRDGWPGFIWAVTTAWSSLLRDLKRARREW